MASKGSKSPSTPPTNKSKRPRLLEVAQPPSSEPRRRSSRSPKPRSSQGFVQASPAMKATPPWPEGDVIALLRAAVDFRSRTGKTPSESQIFTLFDSLRGSLSVPDLTPKIVWNKLYRLRRNYKGTVISPLPDSATDHERLVAQLSALAWGDRGEENNERAGADADVGGDTQEVEGDADDSSSSGSFHYFNHYVEECLKRRNITLPPEALEAVEPSVKKALDEKVRDFVKDGLRRQVIRCDLDKEIFDLLVRATSK